MDSTIKSNATVGPPIEVLVYEKDSYSSDHYIKMEEDDEYLRSVKMAWNDALKDAFSKLPPFHWENRGAANAQAVNDQSEPPRNS
jgi:putative proteasome-type protease